MYVTVINAGCQNNVLPAECDCDVDIGINEKCTNHEVPRNIKSNISCKGTSISKRLKSIGLKRNVSY